MSGSLFTPKLKQVVEPEPDSVAIIGEDNISKVLHKVAQYAVIILFGLLPVFFVPGLWASLGFDKTVLSISFGLIVVVVVGLLMLRQTQGLTALPISLGLFWLVSLVALISGLLSGDVQDALRGSVMETHTASFIAVLGLLMTIPLVLQGSKIMTIKALALFGFSATLLLLYNVSRLIFGGEFLSLGSFGVATVSPIGGFNDLAIFAGLIVILGLITLIQLPLKGWLQYALSFLVLASLFILSVVNFFNVWLVVGFFALLMFIYILSRDTLFKNPESTIIPSSRTPRVLIITTAMVCIFSAVFVVAGDYAGGKISQMTNVTYVEVRPSTSATIAIIKEVYSDNILLGVGPNRFADAWRQYKDRSINETVFWDTDFNAGSGYVPTLFVNLGLLGGILVIIFHAYFLYLGYRMLLRSVSMDSYWYYFGVTSFASACFIWGMSYIYVPGAGILLLGAMFTGFTFVAASALLPSMVKTVPLVTSRQRGFFLMAALVIVVVSSVGILFSVTKQYVSQTKFIKSQVTASSIQEFEQNTLNAFQLYTDDRFLSTLAQIQLANLNSLLTVPEPTEDEQRQFMTAAERSLLFAEQALAEDPTNPDNHAVLASIYNSLATAGIEGAKDRAIEVLQGAEKLDPYNPAYRLIAAQMAAQTGDAELAREEVAASLRLKNNFTQALYLSAQLDISEGNTASAIATTRSIAMLEPNNPTRYFQLGVLLSAEGNFDEAISAFQAAISIDPAYANARYLLALVYLELGRSDSALEHLRIVQETNEENEELRLLIQQVESGDLSSVPDFGLSTPVNEVAPREDFEDTVTVDGTVDTDLVSPVNTVSNTQSEVEIVEEDDQSPEENIGEETESTDVE